MAWGKEWPKIGCMPPKTEIQIPNDKVFFMTENGVKEWPSSVVLQDGKPILENWDLGTGDKTILTTFENGEIKHIEIKPEELYKKEYNNKVPTHDPYTNPDAQIYYECGCGAILDPGTKSFAALNGHASDKGWKIRFGETGYTPYCVKCGEGVE